MDKAPAVGDRLNVKFKDGRGALTDMVKAGKEIGLDWSCGCALARGGTPDGRIERLAHTEP